MQYVTLNTGAQMPQLGFGVYQIPEKETERIVSQAIKQVTVTLIRHNIIVMKLVLVRRLRHLVCQERTFSSQPN